MKRGKLPSPKFTTLPARVSSKLMTGFLQLQKAFECFHPHSFLQSVQGRGCGFKRGSKVSQRPGWTDEASSVLFRGPEQLGQRHQQKTQNGMFRQVQNGLGPVCRQPGHQRRVGNVQQRQRRVRSCYLYPPKIFLLSINGFLTMQIRGETNVPWASGSQTVWARKSCQRKDQDSTQSIVIPAYIFGLFLGNQMFHS